MIVYDANIFADRVLMAIRSRQPQQERRFLWYPKSPGRNLDGSSVTVGSLRDVAELVVL